VYRVLFLAACLVTQPAAASADWLTVYNKDEFDGKDRYFAVTSAKEPLFGFVCDAETARVRALFKTNEKTTHYLRRQLPAHAAIAVIVDDQKPLSYPGKLFIIDRVVSIESFHESIFDLAKQLSAAKRRVLVAVDWKGEKWARQEFPVAGAGPAIQKLLGVCSKLKPR